MSTTQSQVKLNIPLPLKELLAVKASHFGVTMSAYIRYLIIQNVQNDIPFYQASEMTEKQYKKALKDQEKAIKISGSADQFLDNA